MISPPNTTDELPDAGVRHAKWRYVWLVGAVVYVLAIWWVGWGRFLDALSAFNPVYLIWVSLAGALALWLRIAKWRFALGRGQQALSLFFMSKAAGDMTPSRVGELSPLLLRRHRTPRVAAWLAVDRLLEITATLAFGALGTLALTSPSPQYQWMIAASACLLVIAPMILITRRSFFVWVAARIPRHSVFYRTARFLSETSGEVLQLRHKLPVALALTLLCTGLDICAGLLAYRGFGYDLSFLSLALVQCAHGIVSAVPFLPNATGAPYVAGAVLLNQVGSVPYEVVAATVTLFMLVLTTVFWVSLGAGMWMTNRAAHPAPKGQADIFDHLAAADCLYEYSPDALMALNALAASKGRVLDVGCGDGTLGAALDGDCVVGVDISPRCAVLATRKGVKALVADAIAGLPFAAESFDTVYCVDVLHHLGQAWDAVFSELDRLLCPGGVMIIVEPDARNPLVRWTQAPTSPIRVAPCDDEPAIHVEELLPHLEGRGYACEHRPYHLEARQVVRDVFPLWQRLLKAPFVMALALCCVGRPNKFLLTARKPQ